jgi:hypothetical protein
MKYGINLPPFGKFSDPRAVADLARGAEDAGWDGFFLWDHIAFYDDDIADPWICLTAAALATTRIRLGTMVTPLARRRPQKLARETVTLDRLSGGRLILGVGLGIHPEEFERLGEDPDWKVRGCCWGAGMWPNKPPFRRAAKWDGVFPIDPKLQGLTPEAIAEIIAYIRSHRETDDPFEVVYGGATSGPNDTTTVKRFGDAGVTWWHEWMNASRQDRVAVGPPRV